MFTLWQDDFVINKHRKSGGGGGEKEREIEIYFESNNSTDRTSFEDWNLGYLEVAIKEIYSWAAQWALRFIVIK